MSRNISTRFEPKTRERLPEPLVACPYDQVADEIDDSNPGAVRKAAPYKAGDIILVNKGTANDPDIRFARVVRAHVDYLDSSMRWIPKYRVQLANKGGFWAMNWTYVFPGAIYRAFFDGDDKPRAEHLYLIPKKYLES